MLRRRCRRSLKQLKEWEPHNYQKEAVKFLIERGGAGLFLDPGLGKTSITLAAIKIMKDKGLLSKVLLLAPLRVCKLVWPEEVQKWTNFNGLKVAVLHGPNKDELLQEPADIYVMNPEGLEWLAKPVKVKTRNGKTNVTVDVNRWKQFGFDTLVIDELSKFKNPQSVRFKILKTVLHTFARRWGLTGSPASNGLMDLFGQCYCLDMGRSLGQYITHYRAQYFNQGFDGFSYEIKPGAEEAIYKRISPLVLRMGEELIDMPKAVERDITVELPPKVMKIYKQLEDDFLAKIGDGVITARSAATASIKLRQVASGAVYKDEDTEALIKLKKTEREWYDLHDAKLEALRDLVEELQGQPLLVAYDFKHDLEKIQKAFGWKLPHIGGGVSPAQSLEIADAWNAGRIPLLLGHPASMGHGLNLQAVGKHVCWYSPTWNYELYDQFNRRIRRQGSQATRVYIYRIIARDTIDKIVATALKSKRYGQNALFEALKGLQNNL